MQGLNHAYSLAETIMAATRCRAAGSERATMQFCQPVNTTNRPQTLHCWSRATVAPCHRLLSSAHAGYSAAMPAVHGTNMLAQACSKTHLLLLLLLVALEVHSIQCHCQHDAYSLDTTVNFTYPWPALAPARACASTSANAGTWQHQHCTNCSPASCSRRAL